MNTRFSISLVSLLIASMMIANTLFAQTDTMEIRSPLDPLSKAILSGVPVGESVELHGTDLEALILNDIAKGDTFIESWQFADGTKISNDSFVGGMLVPNQSSGIFSVVSNSLALGDELALTSQQVAEIRALQSRLMDSVRKETGGRQLSESEIADVISKNATDFEREILDVLLDHQKDAIRKLVVQRLGLTGTLFYHDLVFESDRGDSREDRDDLAELAKEQIEQIDTSIVKLKKEVFQAIESRFSMKERDDLEELIGKNLEAYFVALPLETIVSHLEFMKNRGSQPVKSIREFVEEKAVNGRQ